MTSMADGAALGREPGRIRPDGTRPGFRDHDLGGDHGRSGGLRHVQGSVIMIWLVITEDQARSSQTGPSLHPVRAPHYPTNRAFPQTRSIDGPALPLVRRPPATTLARRCHGSGIADPLLSFALVEATTSPGQRCRNHAQAKITEVPSPQKSYPPRPSDAPRPAMPDLSPREPGPSDRASDRATERPSDRATERPSDRATEENPIR
jgi:hypothetical protein